MGRVEALIVLVVAGSNLALVVALPLGERSIPALLVLLDIDSGWVPVRLLTAPSLPALLSTTSFLSSFWRTCLLH